MEKVRKILIVFFAVIMVVSGAMSIMRYMELTSEQNSFEKVQEEMTMEPVASTEASAEVPTTQSEETLPVETEPAYEPPEALAKLMGEYPDCIGWIKIDDTKVDYPIMQNEDNEYYLHRDMDGNDSNSGCIYLDSNHDINEKGLHVIYGHHMKNGTMFKDVYRYVDESYMEKHQNITITTDKQELKLRPVYRYTDVADGTYRMQLKTHGQVIEFIKNHTGQEINTDNLFVLVTCEYTHQNGRLYLYCIPVEEDTE